ncbi:AfsR/SARP family transcriptional regulator [Micromonospora deserti]|nr:BTAD domain-containing putative transcriptional regulator [Micromonospora deserti]
MSLLFVLALLTSPPVVLLLLIGPPVRGWPSMEQAREWVQEPLTEQTLAGALTIGAWLLWLMLAYTVAMRVLVRLRETSAWLRRLPLPTPLQATASGMAGAAVFGVTTNALTTAPPQPPEASPVALQDEPPPDDPGEATHDDGIEVSGGWLPRDAAEQLAAAAALVWLRRRRDYQPRPTSRDDTDLAPLPPTVAAVQAALADTPTPPAALTTNGISALVEVLPAGGVGLTGPGALPIGRGMLVTALIARNRHPTTSLITTKAALASLLGPAAETLGRRLPLTIADSLDELVRLVHAANHSADPYTTMQRQDAAPREAGHRQIVLLDEGDGDETQVKHVVEASVATAAVVVALGDWPGPTWHADSAGYLHDPHQADGNGPRLCVLDQTAATDLLTIIALPDPAPPDPTTPRSSLPRAGSPDPRLPRQATRHEPRLQPHVPRQRPYLRVLGDPQLLIDGEPLAIRRSAALQILVYLATHPTGADTAQLTDAIWPGLPRRSLTGRLYTALSDLRGTIRAACGLHVIDHVDDRYRLNPAHVDVDLWHLDAAIDHAATTRINTSTAWQAVLDAYPADLAATRTWPWLDPIREATRRRILDICVSLATAEPDSHQAFQLLQAGIRIDPYNADLHKHASRALTALGNHEAAAELHDHYRQTLTRAGVDDPASHRLSPTIQQ